MTLILSLCLAFSASIALIALTTAPKTAFATSDRPDEKTVRITFVSRESREPAALGQTYDRTFQIRNAGKVSCFLKVKKPTIYADGNYVDWEYILKSGDWEDGNDGYWYRPTALAKGDTATLKLGLAVPHDFDFEVTKSSTPVEEYVTAEAVQAEEYIPEPIVEPSAPIVVRSSPPVYTSAPAPVYRQAFNDTSLPHDQITSSVSDGSYVKDPAPVTPLADPSTMSNTVNQVGDELKKDSLLDLWPYFLVALVALACVGFLIFDRVRKAKAAKGAGDFAITNMDEFGYDYAESGWR